MCQQLLTALPVCFRTRRTPQGTVVEKSINYLFEGHTESYVECKNIDVRSTKRESFMDIQLVVKVCFSVGVGSQTLLCA